LKTLYSYKIIRLRFISKEEKPSPTSPIKEDPALSIARLLRREQVINSKAYPRNQRKVTINVTSESQRMCQLHNSHHNTEQPN
jgi:hypothetical protein